MTEPAEDCVSSSSSPAVPATVSAEDSQFYRSPAQPAMLASAAAVKLPEFWQNDPASWFQHVEALFKLRSVDGDDSRYYLVVAALDQQSTCRVMSVLRSPPLSGKYTALKQLLLRRFGLSSAERADSLLSLPGLGDSTAVDLMDTMLSLLGSDDGGFLFPHIFLRQLPPSVRAALANSPCMTAGDYRGLAEEADRVLLATRRFAVQTVTASPTQMTTDGGDVCGFWLKKNKVDLLAATSPPRFVSVEEVMETAKGVTNMALAHEMMVNQAFQVKATELPEGSLERKVKEIMHKAFWDCLEAQLKEEPPSYEHSVRLLGEIKETLLSFLLPGHGRLRSQIEEVLDLPLIQQQAENGALDIGQLSQFIVGMMGSLCAPCRDEDINKLKEITDIVPLLKAIFSVLDLMKVDMANFALISIRPHLMQQSVEYERNKFQEFLEKQPNALDYTKKWLEETVKFLRETDGCGAASHQSSSLMFLNVHNHAYLRLLKWDHAVDPFPETVLMDQVRFQEMQQEAERLVLLSSVLLIVYTTTGEAISGLPGLMETIKNTVSVMLADMHAPSFCIQEALATIGEKLCVELSHCLSRHGYSPFSDDCKGTLKGQISAVIQPDNTVRKLMDSRVQSYLLASLESSQHKTPPPLPGGLAPVSRELKELSVHFSRLVNFNKLVFSPFYQKILQEILTSGDSPNTEA